MTASDAAPTPVPFHVETRSDDPDEVPELIAQVYAWGRFGLGQPGAFPPRFHSVMAGDSRLAFARMAFSIPMYSDNAIGDDVLMFYVRRRGAITVELGKTEVDATRPLLFPSVRYLGTVDEHVDGLSVSIPTAVLASAARALHGEGAPPLRFTGANPISPSADRYWARVAGHVEATLTDPVMLQSDLVRGEVIRNAVRTTLLCFPNTVLHAETRTPRPPRPGPVDRAVTFLESEAGRDIGVDEIAAIAGTTPHALSAAFRSRFGRTVLQYLRDARYARARQDLLNADPWSGHTVRDVALRWGFPSPGRFAVEYRRRFDESPSATLQR